MTLCNVCRYICIRTCKLRADRFIHICFTFLSIHPSNSMFEVFLFCLCLCRSTYSSTLCVLTYQSIYLFVLICPQISTYLFTCSSLGISTYVHLFIFIHVSMFHYWFCLKFKDDLCISVFAEISRVSW